MRRCKCCNEPIKSNNKRRKYCKLCKKRYPYRASTKDSPPFIRRDIMKRLTAPEMTKI